MTSGSDDPAGAEHGATADPADPVDPVDPKADPGFGKPTNDQDDLAGADDSGGGVSNRDPG